MTPYPHEVLAYTTLSIRSRLGCFALQGQLLGMTIKWYVSPDEIAHKCTVLMLILHDILNGRGSLRNNIIVECENIFLS